MESTGFMVVKAFEINIEKAFKKCFWSSPHNEKFETAFGMFEDLYIVFLTLKQGKVMLQGIARMTGPIDLEPFNWPRLAKSYNGKCFPIEWVIKGEKLGGLPTKFPNLIDGMQLSLSLARDLVKRINTVAQKRHLEGKANSQKLLDAFPDTLPEPRVITKERKRRGLFDHRIDKRRQPTLQDMLAQ